MLNISTEQAQEMGALLAMLVPDDYDLAEDQAVLDGIKPEPDPIELQAAALETLYGEDADPESEEYRAAEEYMELQRKIELLKGPARAWIMANMHDPEALEEIQASPLMSKELRYIKHLDAFASGNPCDFSDFD
jgi:hypothetical protein